MSLHVRAPWRVNLIGDHTDYTGGMVLPMAIDRWTEIRGVGAEAISLRSEDEPLPAELDLTLEDPRTAEPHWAKYVAGVVAEMRPARGIAGTVTTDIPIGGGLSSRAALAGAGGPARGFAGRGGRPGTGRRRRRTGARADLPSGRVPRLGRALRDHGSTGHRRRGR